MAGKKLDFEQSMARLEEIRRTTGAQIGALEQERDGFAARS